jgi:hypothetical protein
MLNAAHLACDGCGKFGKMFVGGCKYSSADLHSVPGYATTANGTFRYSSKKHAATNIRRILLCVSKPLQKVYESSGQ